MPHTSTDTAGFAVIDFETTGLVPELNDRAVEVAVVHVSPSGDIEGAWETLINPQRDLGRQDIHRIQAAEILAAPTFDRIAGQLGDLLTGRVVVAHNAGFDARFLNAEMGRVGVHDFILPEGCLCTMRLSKLFLQGGGRSLADCCAAYDIALDGAHRASVDATATALLLANYMEQEPRWAGWAAALGEASGRPRPAIPRFETPWLARSGARARRTHTAKDFLVRLVEHAPDLSGTLPQQEYVALLDRCLIDRALSVHEQDALVNLATQLGLSRTVCAGLHVDYFRALAALAWADGDLSDEETSDLAAVAHLLDIPADEVEAAGTRPTPDAEPIDETVRAASFRLQAGDLICLTGEMSQPRSEWERALTGEGYTVWPSVTKRVTLVVAADPDSLSGKARKARAYGIPIVSEDGLARLLDAR